MSAKTQRKAKSKVKRHTAKRRRRVNRYCVIAIEAVNRMWFDNEAEAVKHAEPMIRADGRHVDHVMVVKAVKIVERAEPPLTVREPKDYDFAATSVAERAEAIAKFKRERE